MNKLVRGNEIAVFYIFYLYSLLYSLCFPHAYVQNIGEDHIVLQAPVANMLFIKMPMENEIIISHWLQVFLCAVILWTVLSHSSDIFNESL